MPKDRKKFKKDPAGTMGTFSKNLLGLKFMQRAKKEIEKMIEERDDSFDSSICQSMRNKQHCIMNHSYQFCERLRFGRLSFKGMNPEIESIMIANKPNQPELDTSSEKRRAPPSEGETDDDEIDIY